MADAARRIALDFLTGPDVAVQLKISERHLRQLVKDHRVPVLRMGRSLRFDAAALRHLIEATRCRSASSAEKTPEPSGSWARFVPPTKSEESEFASALRLMIEGSRKKKHAPLRSRSSEIAILERSPKAARSTRRPSPT